MVVKRLGASVMALLGQVWFVSMQKLTQIALIKQVPAYFTLLQPLRTFWYLARTSPTHLLKPHPPNKDFSSTQTVLSMSGGSAVSLLFNLGGSTMKKERTVLL
jgi:hypothetical protein